MNRNLIILASACILSFVAGLVAMSKFTTEQPASQSTQKDIQKNVKKTITKIKEKDGTEKTVTVIDSQTETTTKTNKKTEVLPKYSQWRAGALLGVDQHQNKTKGVFVQHQFIVTFDIGAYVLDNHSYGFILSVGF